MTVELNRLGAAKAVQLLQDGAIAPRALLQACLDRIAAREATVEAWEHIAADAFAQLEDGAHGTGVLRGLPIGIKDNIDTADMPTAYGSPIYAGHRPSADAECVARLRRAGAIILGKTVSTEFAYFEPRKTRNPLSPERTPGGSSSGSAAAVADFMVPVALGTQTAGSVIRPASFCGVIGYKPTYGLIDLAGVRPLARSLDTLGLFARSLDDLELLAPVLMDRVLPEGDIRSQGAPALAFARMPDLEQAHPGAFRVCAMFKAALAAAGLGFKEIDVSPATEGLIAVQDDIMAFEAARHFDYEYENRREQLSTHFAALIEKGRRLSPQHYQDMVAIAERSRRTLRALMDGTDILIAPSAPGEAPPRVDGTGNAAFNRAWTLLHGPCLTYPWSTGPSGLPVGIQLIGLPRTDRRMIRGAKWLFDRLGR